MAKGYYIIYECLRSRSIKRKDLKFSPLQEVTKEANRLASRGYLVKEISLI